MTRLGFVVLGTGVLIALSVPPSFAGRDSDNTPPSPARSEDLGAREALVEQILVEAEGRAQKAWDAGARENLKRGLMTRSSAELSQAASGGRALESLMRGKTLGSALNDWVFTPVPSCRLLDTRPGSGIQGAGAGPLAPGAPFAFDVAGGAAASCLIPFPDAKAVSINFIAVGAAGNGNLRTWPWDSSLPAQPATAVITYTNGFNTSNGVVIPICNTATATGGSCASDLFVQTNANSSHVVADVFGYFAAPLITPIFTCRTDSGPSTLLANGGSTLFTLGGVCTPGEVWTAGWANWFLHSAGCQPALAQATNLHSHCSLDLSGTTTFCYLHNASGVDRCYAISARCCRSD